MFTKLRDVWQKLAAKTPAPVSHRLTPEEEAAAAALMSLVVTTACEVQKLLATHGSGLAQLGKLAVAGFKGQPVDDPRTRKPYEDVGPIPFSGGPHGPAGPDAA